MAQMEPQIDADFFLTALAYKQRTVEYLNDFFRLLRRICENLRENKKERPE